MYLDVNWCKQACRARRIWYAHIYPYFHTCSHLCIYIWMLKQLWKLLLYSQHAWTRFCLIKITLLRVIPTLAFQVIYSDIYFDIILPNILSDIYSDILSGISSSILSGITIFPHLPGEGCQIWSELLSSSFSSSSASSSSFSSTMSASTSTSTSALPTLRQALRQLPSSVRTAGPQPGTFPAQWLVGPSQLSAHRWTSTWDLPSSVRTAGTQPGTFPAQCAPLDLNLGPSELSAHRWTSTWDLPSSVRTAGPPRPDRMPEDMPDKVPECLPDRMP